MSWAVWGAGVEGRWGLCLAQAKPSSAEHEDTLTPWGHKPLIKTRLPNEFRLRGSKAANELKTSGPRRGEGAQQGPPKQGAVPHPRALPSPLTLWARREGLCHLSSPRWAGSGHRPPACSTAPKGERCPTQLAGAWEGPLSPELQGGRVLLPVGCSDEASLCPELVSQMAEDWCIRHCPVPGAARSQSVTSESGKSPWLPGRCDGAGWALPAAMCLVSVHPSLEIPVPAPLLGDLWQRSRWWGLSMCPWPQLSWPVPWCRAVPKGGRWISHAVKDRFGQQLIFYKSKKSCCCCSLRQGAEQEEEEEWRLEGSRAEELIHRPEGGLLSAPRSREPQAAMPLGKARALVLRWRAAAVVAPRLGLSKDCRNGGDRRAGPGRGRGSGWGQGEGSRGTRGTRAARGHLRRRT